MPLSDHMLQILPRCFALLLIAVLLSGCRDSRPAGSGALLESEVAFATIVLPPDMIFSEREGADSQWTRVELDDERTVRLDQARDYRIRSDFTRAGFFEANPELASFKITELVVGFSEVPTHGDKDVLSKMQSLTKIELSRVKDNADGQWISKLANLESVQLPPESVEESLVRSILQRESLRELVLAAGGNTPIKLSLLSGSSVESLELHWWDLRDVSLPSMTRLKRLELRGGEVGEPFMSSLAEMPNLVELDLYRAQPLVDDLSLLRACMKLESLSLNGCSTITDASFASLSGHPNLRAISMDWSPGGRHVSAQSAPALTEASLKTLAELPRLHSLSLWKSPLAKKETLLEIGRLDLVEELTVDGTDFASVVSAFESSRRLHSLRLLGTVGESLARSLQSLPVLKELDLSRNSDVDDGILSSLSKIESLRSLNVRGTRVTAAGLKAFSSSRADVIVLGDE